VSSRRSGERLPRYRTGDADLDQRIVDLLDAVEVRQDRDLLFEILTSAVRLAGDDADRLDLKITNSALKEMRLAFRLFAPYRDIPKVTIFGSARTAPDDPLYEQTRELASTLANQGWMVVTGAGPGIMAAGVEGAGPESSIGVTISLPFEKGANAFLATDDKLVEMKYFFTRKLMLMKESAGFAVLPGGFGTLDEAFELLTLLQTGKAAPAPIVLLELPGGSYWKAWERFLVEEVLARGLISEHDFSLFRITDDVAAATDEILGFYASYHSIRFVGDVLVVRLSHAPDDVLLKRINADFADILATGRIERSEPRPAEVSSNDHLDLPRIAFHFDRLNYGRLRQLIDVLNGRVEP
jgi:uncharacterized protein (TIGR00730 family)